MTITDEEVAALKAKAEAATAGPWEVAGPFPRVSVGIADHSTDDPSVGYFGFTPIAFMAEDTTTDNSADHPDAAYIAAANPTAILALIERASGQGDAVDAARYRWLRDKQAYVAVQRHHTHLPIRERTGWTIRLVSGNDDSFDAAIDAAIRNADREGT